MNRPRTWIVDIDGLLLEQTEGCFNKEARLLPGVRTTLGEISDRGDHLIIITGRRESCRKQTEEQLFKNNIFYDALVMGVGIGERILINDMSKDGVKKAFAINVSRDEGLININTKKMKREKK
jgi:phosphoserine phosphatase